MLGPWRIAVARVAPAPFVQNAQLRALHTSLVAEKKGGKRTVVLHSRSKRRHSPGPDAAEPLKPRRAEAGQKRKGRKTGNQRKMDKVVPKPHVLPKAEATPSKTETAPPKAPGPSGGARRAPRPTSFLRGDDAVRSRIVRLEELEKESLRGAQYGRLTAGDVTVEPVRPLRNMDVARLAHGLDRVLFNPGIHWLRDRHTGIYNYDPHLRKVLDVDLFDYGALPPYLTSSRDPELLEITEKQGKRYCGSTSSMTGLLSHCYYLLSRWKEPELSGFSPAFGEMPTGFSEGAKMPVSIVLRRQPSGFYAIDADKFSDGDAENSNYVLTSLGKSLEKFLTASPQEYRLYERINSWKLSEEVRNQQEAYHYAKTEKLLMRSQLDCHDPRLPNGTFDLKTRAVVSVRHDRANYPEASGYQIQYGKGLWESFEREYFDMVRAAFLKYNFQARIGHMDGIFVAYHNTSQIFGFQYIPLKEMNLRLFGSNEMGDAAYNLCLGLLEKILDTVTAQIPDESVAVTLETRSGANAMTVFAESTSGGRLLQWDVTMDRYLNDALVRGPVDFAALRAPFNDAQLEDMVQGRQGDGFGAIAWHVDYHIQPRDDLPEEKMRATLQDIRNRQRTMQSMCLPNVDLLNEREKYRVDVLKKRPDALRRFLQEREDGTAIGMPLAPGQLTARALMEREGLKVGRLPPPSLPPSVKWQRIPDATTRKLRELSRRGAEVARDEASSDPLTIYQSYSK